MSVNLIKTSNHVSKVLETKPQRIPIEIYYKIASNSLEYGDIKLVDKIIQHFISLSKELKEDDPVVLNLYRYVATLILKLKSYTDLNIPYKSSILNTFDLFEPFSNPRLLPPFLMIHRLGFSLSPS